MADNVLVDNGDESDFTVASDDDGTAQHQYVKLEYGADGTFTKVATGANALPIQDGGNSITVDGTLAVTQSGTWDEVGINDSGNSITVDDGGASLTVDNAALAVTGGGVESSALRVTIANDSTGVVSVDDNGSTLSVDDGGGALTVDGTVSVSGAVDTELTTADLDTGAGTDTRAVVGLVGSASGGGALIPGSATDGLLVNLGSNNDVTVSGVATAANQSTLIGHVDGVETLLGTIDADTSTLAGAVSGSEVQVDVVAALPAGNNNIGDVDVASSALPTGASTSANQSTIIGHLDGVESALGAIQTAVETLDNTVAGSELQVDIVSAPTLTVNSHAVTNAGTFATQESGAALTALQLLDDAVVADDAAFTPATTKTHMAGFFADETSTDSVDEGDGGAARMTLDRKQIVVNQPHTAGGCSIFRSLDLDESEEEVKGTAGTVYGWYIANTATSTRFVKFYNGTAASVTVGTTTPVLTFPIPGNSSDDVAANLLGGVGISFDTAITVAATTAVADNDTGAPGANEVIVNIFYK